MRQRRDGYRQALGAAGLRARAGHVLAGAWSEAFGREAVQQLMTSRSGVDAIFCGSDQIARGVIDALRESGVRVPDDVAVVGFDNWDVIAAATRPAITTVDMNLHELGRQAGLAPARHDGRPAAQRRRAPALQPGGPPLVRRQHRRR